MQWVIDVWLTDATTFTLRSEAARVDMLRFFARHSGAGRNDEQKEVFPTYAFGYRNTLRFRFTAFDSSMRRKCKSNLLLIDQLVTFVWQRTGFLYRSQH